MAARAAKATYTRHSASRASSSARASSSSRRAAASAGRGPLRASRRAGYVRNIHRCPEVRVRFREDLRFTWHRRPGHQRPGTVQFGAR
ncbi:hypothetical protein [Streptomyces sp. NPDC001450]